MVVRAFVDEASARMAAIRAAMARGVIQSVRHEAHALTGAARNVGLARLAGAAEALQKISAQKLPDAATVDVVATALRDALPLAAAWADAHENLAAASG